MMSMLLSNIKFYIRAGVLDFQDSGGDLTRGGEISGGLRTPSELCFGTSEIECSASLSYIMYTFLTLL